MIQDFKTNIVISLPTFFLIIIALLLFIYSLYFYTEDINNFKLLVVFILVYISIFILFSNSAKDNILLFFNKISNDFGTNWVQGVCFTIIMAGITFIVMAAVSGYTISLSENALSTSWI